MAGRSVEKAVVASRGEQWDSLRSLVAGLEGERDLEGLAAVAETALVALRELCERPVTCQELDEMLGQLRALKIDAFEMGEEE